ncbi:anhydro-N-acetylmuramic acid kinase [Pseudoalteromonas sp. H105]|jgi:anhydro-N-acetylmuramic acid kinase|uniref:anhydro-N-acetylmuramic acid kinase n=1 Tax=Pseudoalteromonas sp. H105 TaxID=1348393 RepID=UPI000731F487|nr:anhydro-N-acetylmuramic acid kinase [Pseudoalteromonas sp. H105]KTF09185.1 anhydro-N-acetylmuramic acid kinase [Pseudoalteromonas sp. H105]
MHPHIAKLYESANKPHKLIIGLMSGTSLDGLDVALCKISNHGMNTNLALIAFDTIAYDENYKQKIRTVFAKRECDLEQVTLLHPWIGRLHGSMVNQCLAKWGVSADSIDVIASHGQTIYHCPKSQHGQDDFGHGTLQIGDSDHIAVTTGITTLGDFRQKHIAAGGEGAPLAVYGDYLFFTSRTENRILLNMGGIANLTFLPQSAEASAVFSSDVGPGNTIMDAYIQQYFKPLSYDVDSKIASQGQVNQALLSALCDDPFFQQPFPKTTGPEIFNLQYLARAQVLTNTTELAHSDVMATLTRFSAQVIADAINRSSTALDSVSVYASGGGVHNPLLMEHILFLCPQLTAIQNTHVLGIHPDAKEAVLFAILANECLSGGQARFGNTAQGIPDVTMGKVSFAD